MIRSAIRWWAASTLLVTILVDAQTVRPQEQVATPDALVRLSFHHVVFDMVDSVAEVTEMLIFQNSDSVPYQVSAELGGMKIQPAEGFSNLRLGGQPGDWRVNSSHDELAYVAPLASGMTRLVLSYDLTPENGVVEFVQQVAHSTGKYVFVTSNPRVKLESAVLAEEESIPSGETEVRGLNGEDLSAGTRVVVVATLSAPTPGRSSSGFSLVLICLAALSAVIYATARMARRACTGDPRLVELEERKESIEKAIAALEGEKKRAYEEKLAATDRLINLIVDIRKRGTDSP